jgi:hypothetical protein
MQRLEMRGGDHVEDLFVDVRIIFKWMLKKLVRPWGLVHTRTEIS